MFHPSILRNFYYVHNLFGPTTLRYYQNAEFSFNTAAHRIFAVQAIPLPCNSYPLIRAYSLPKGYLSSRANAKVSQEIPARQGQLCCPFAGYLWSLPQNQNTVSLGYARFSAFLTVPRSRRIFSWSSVRAYINCSGRGGHPGTYTSTGIIWLTPCTSA